MSWSVNQKMTRRLALVVMAVMALGISGCLITYDPDSVELADVGSTYLCTESERSLNVLSPTDEMEISSDILVVDIVVCGIDLVEKWGQENSEGEGHLVVSVDGRYAHPPGEGLVTCRFGLPLDDFDPGDHVFRAQVRNNDLTEIEDIPPVEVNFTIVAGE